jgi:hypothetical protein
MPFQKNTKQVDRNLFTNKNIEPSLFTDVNYRQQYEQTNIVDSVNEAMKKDLFESKVSLGEKQKYSGSDEQLTTYENLESNDPQYARYIIRTYGSYANFLFVNQLKRNPYETFDPRYDFLTDVTVITKEKFYKTNHISAQETILEALSGICTVDFLRKNGSADKILGTLNKSAINSNKASERYNFFSPLPGNRIVLWNLIKKDWSSFYMNGLIRFVRDDTIGIE